MAGRKRNPTGTAQPTGGRPVAPGYLGADEREAFDLLVKQLDGAGLLSSAHSETIALAAARRVEIEQLGAAVDEHGAVYTAVGRDGQTLVKPNPAVRMRSEALRHLHALLAELGLTPTSVAKATPPKMADKENRFAKFAKK